MLGCDKIHVVLLCPGHAALEHGGQEHARHVEDGLQRVVRELHLVVHAVGGIAHGFQRGLAHGQQLGVHTLFAVEPEVLAVAVAIVHGQRREVLRAYAVDDGVTVLFLHEDAVDLEDEVGAELGGDAVEVVIRRLIAVQHAGLVVLRVVQLAHPGALDHLDRVREHHGALLAGLLLDLALLQAELALGHLVLGLVAGPGELDALLEGFGVVVHKVDGTLAAAEDVLCGVGGVAAAQQHRVVILARDVVGLAQGIGPQRGGAILAQRADDHCGHREEQGGLVEVVYHAQVFKARHVVFSFS